MGVVTKYALDLMDGEITVSNDLFSGEFIVDADVTAELLPGTAGGLFEVKLFDLPESKANTLLAAAKKDKFVRVDIDLGYFDQPFERVMVGLATEVKVDAEGSRLITTLKGVEEGTYALSKGEVASTPFPPGTQVVKVVKQLLQKAKLPKGSSIDRKPTVKGVDATLTEGMTASGKVMRVLGELAERAQAELFVFDKSLFMGRPVVHDGLVKLAYDVNLASFQPFQKEIPEKEAYVHVPPPAKEARGFRFLAAGDPTMRPGQKVVADVEGFDSRSGAEFRISGVGHSFTKASGYVCRGVALKHEKGGGDSVRQRAGQRPSAEAIAGILSSRLEDLPRKRPFVAIGKVKNHEPGNASSSPPHRASLYFPKKETSAEHTQPSIAEDVEASGERLLERKPLVSSFAWHKCGLVTPVYPGMKAVLLHNLGLADDALVAGFLWSTKPKMEPPPSRTGDYWLCLPIDPPTTGPTSSTKAANDLVAIDGRRVLGAKSLRILVGEANLVAIGSRPNEAPAKELTIEHESGTIVRIDEAGKVEIKSGTGVSFEGDVSIKGNVSLEGNLEIK